MSDTTTNIGLTVWDLSADSFDHTELAANFETLDDYFVGFDTTTKLVKRINTSATVPATGTAGDVVMLTAANGGYPAYTILRCTATNTWQSTGIEIQSAIPASGNFEGRVIVLTANDSGYLDGDVLRYNGSAWTLIGPQPEIPPSLSRVINQATHGFSVGNVVKFTGSTYSKARADDGSGGQSMNVVGIVSAVADVNTFTLLIEGYMSGLSGLSAGTAYYLSASTAGALTATPPGGTAGNINQRLLIATSTTTGYFLGNTHSTTHAIDHSNLGGDAFTDSMLIDAKVRNIQVTDGGGTKLAVGSVADGYLAKRSGTALIGQNPELYTPVVATTVGGLGTRTPGRVGMIYLADGEKVHVHCGADTNWYTDSFVGISGGNQPANAAAGYAGFSEGGWRIYHPGSSTGNDWYSDTFCYPFASCVIPHYYYGQAAFTLQVRLSGFCRSIPGDGSASANIGWGAEYINIGSANSAQILGFQNVASVANNPYYIGVDSGWQGVIGTQANSRELVNLVLIFGGPNGASPQLQFKGSLRYRWYG
jgi:hypothetical protein